MKQNNNDNKDGESSPSPLSGKNLFNKLQGGLNRNELKLNSNPSDVNDVNDEHFSEPIENFENIENNIHKELFVEIPHPVKEEDIKYSEINLDSVFIDIKQYFASKFNDTKLNNFLESNMKKEIISINTIWIHLFLIYFSRKDKKLFKKITDEILLLIKEINKKELFLIDIRQLNDFYKKNILYISKIFELLFENQDLQILYSPILSMLNYNINKINSDFLKNVIRNNDLYFLNKLLSHCKKITKDIESLEIKISQRQVILKELITFASLNSPNTNKHELIFDLCFECIENNYEKIINILGKNYKLIQNNIILTLKALDNDCTHFIHKCIKYNRYFGLILLNIEVFRSLIKILLEENLFKDGVFFLFITRKYSYEYSSLHLKMITDYFEKLFETNIISLLSYNLNSFSLILMITDLLYVLSLRKTDYKLKLYNLACKYKEFGYEYMKEINELSILEYFFCETIKGSNLCFYDIFNENDEFYKDFLSSNIMRKVTENLLADGYQFDLNFLSSSTCYNYILGKSHLKYQKVNKIEPETPINNIISPKLQFTPQNASLGLSGYNIFQYINKSNNKDINENNHIHQYLIFSRSIRLKVFISFLLYVGLFYFLYKSLFDASEISSKIIDISKDFLNYVDEFKLPSNYSSLIINNLKNLSVDEGSSNLLYQKYILNNPINIENSFQNLKDKDITATCNDILSLSKTEEMNIYINDCFTAGSSSQQFLSEILTYLFVISLIMMMNSYFFIQIIFFKLNRSKIIGRQVLTLKLCLNLFLFIICIVIIIILILLKNDTVHLTISQWMKYINYVQVLMNVVMALILLEFLFFLRYIERFGKLLSIFMMGAKQLCPYLALFSINIVFFALLMHILFGGYMELFGTYLESLKIMTEAFLGCFQYRIQGSLKVQYFYFTIFTFYVALSITIFLNLLIGTLAATFNKFNEYGNMEFCLLVYELRQTDRYNKYYSSLICYPPPFHLLAFISLPLLIFRKSKKINEFFLKLSYILFSFIIFFLLYVIFNLLILIPLGWLKILLLLTQNKYRTKEGFTHGIKRKENFVHVVIWFTLGLLFLFYNFIFYDIPLYYGSCFNLNDNRIKIEDIDSNNWKLIKRCVKSFQKNNEEIVNLEIFLNKFIDLSNENSLKNINTLQSFPRMKSLFTSKIENIENDQTRNGNINYDDFISYKKHYKIKNLFISLSNNKSEIDIVQFQNVIDYINSFRYKKNKKKQNYNKNKGSFLLYLRRINEMCKAFKIVRSSDLEEERVLEIKDE